MKINFGVFNIPYAENPGKDTGRVALELEKEYGIFQHYAARYAREINDAMAPGIAQYLASTLNYGGDMTGFSAGNRTALMLFRRFIQMKMMDGLVPGVPTLASLHDSRRKFAGESPGTRPSFVETGLYISSVVVWEEY